MFREMNILIIAEFFILNHVSYVLSRRLNLTQLIKESLDPELYYQNLRDISLREVSYLPEEHYNAETGVNKLQQLNRDSRNLIAEYRSLCETETRRVEIADPDYEYQPPHYHAVYCKGYSLPDNNERMMTGPSQQKCVYPIFHCVQRSRIISLVRRRWEDECWEPYTMEIASDCDCMWPVTTLGEINDHY
ncbi:uncharacterized protein [Anoplolepis gracilipes]|uniref:uncharacterized protein isoform X2 n=1 Tax=Anoplolepis gracilipes TaxID=354296 RepID=UPI003B9F333F